MNMRNPNHADEFLPGTSDWPEDLSRRNFLKLSAAALAMAGLSSCIRPSLDSIFTYAKQPEDEVPGKSKFYATHLALGGYAHGLLVETHEGRPTKIEGNPLHPTSLGVASAIEQAWVLSLYDPDRANTIRFQGNPSTWTQFKNTLRGLSGHCAIVTDAGHSPSLEKLISNLKGKFKSVAWYQFDPLLGENGITMPVLDFTQSETVISFGADFLNDPRFPMSYSHDFFSKRPFLFSMESSPTLTGFQSNSIQYWTPLQIENFADQLFHRLNGLEQSTDPFLEKIVTRVLRSGNAIFLADPLFSPRVQAICQELNSRFGKNAISAPDLAPSEKVKTGISGLRSLASDLRKNEVDALFVLGANPIYSAPASLQLKDAFTHAKFFCSANLHEDETAALAQWFVPLSHSLESWGETLTPDGRVSIQQPIIETLFNGKSVFEIVAAINQDSRPTRELLIDHAGSSWGETLSRGASNTEPKLKPLQKNVLPKLNSSDLPFQKNEILISFRPDSKIYDGRFSNHPWLQELPDPITSLTWENVILVSEVDAVRFGIEKGVLLKLTADPHSITGPALILPTQAEGVFTLTFGYGRERVGSVGNGIGYNATALWNDSHLAWNRATLEVLGEKIILPEIQIEPIAHQRDLIKKVSAKNQTLETKSTLSLYPNPPLKDEDKWGMVIDLDICSGCNACMIACQAENNIPTVGKEGVLRGRHMHWIRVDRYFEGKEAHFQPIPCMHCEKAPCEPVCPVGATVHGNGGLNQMIYNRCVGTRYCSNNCPYKVRRFNFLSYEPKTTQLQRMQKNPNVSVRARGVMEKCTYCVQRINEVRIHAKVENRKIKDGEIKTACQSTCPTHAITFGNLADETSAVSKLAHSKRNYALLAELGTRPRTTYLAKIEKSET